MNKPLWQWSACDISAAVKAREISCTEVTTSVIERIKHTNPTLNAMVDDCIDQSLELALQLDQKISKSSPEELPVLVGVPATIKINIDQEGYANSNGIPAFAEQIATQDSPVVKHLKQAGSIIVGRTNTPEFSIRWQTENPLHGLTLNPWNPDITCGGSSGGAATATVMGYGPIAHGNDIGGSLRCPSYCCGTTTVRPTIGRVSAFNSSATEERSFLSQMMAVQGIIAREVKDVRLATEVIAQRDIRDPQWVPVPFFGPDESAPIKVAITKNAYGLPIHPQVKQAIDTAARCLEQAGYIIEEVDPPQIEETGDLWRNLLFTDFKALHEKTIKPYGSDKIQMIMEGYYSVSKQLDRDQMMQSLAHRNRILRNWNLFQEEYQLVLTPLILQPPYPVAEDEKNVERTAEMLLSYLYMSNVNILGLPASTISTHLHNDVPIGVQIIGRRFREDQCLDAAEVIESQQGIMAHKLWQREQNNERK